MPAKPSRQSIPLPKLGGIGVIHKNMDVETQAEEVTKVKRSANGIIIDPVTLRPDADVAAAKALMDQGLVPVIVGSADEAPIMAEIKAPTMPFWS